MGVSQVETSEGVFRRETEFLRQVRLSITGVAVLTGILITFVGVFSYLNRGGEQMEEGRIVVRAGSEVIGEITIDEIMKLPVAYKKMTIRSTAGLTKHEYTVTPLSGVFDALDPKIALTYQRIITKGSDNYVSVFSMKEVLDRNNIYLAYADYGEPLQSRSGEGNGIKIVSMEDQFGQRFTSYLVEMRLE